MIKGFHVELTNICTLKCAGCARTRFIDKWPQHWHNHSLDVDHLLRFLDVDLSDKLIVLCGNYGDPIYHPEFINVVGRLKETGAALSIVTNGSYKTKHWWQELTALLTHKDNITFSVDGIPENFTQYRKNADWKSIQVGMEVSAESLCRTTWSYIPFSFNQNNIDQAKELSLQLGIDNFIVSPSDRYDDQTIQLIPTSSDLVKDRFKFQQDWKKDKSVSGITPKCQTGKDHFITADGFYSPCCYVADHRFYYKTMFGKNKKQYDITAATLSELLQQPTVVEFYSTLDQHSACQYNCPSSST
jgi:MoaA/NifB/PqqE/SkfB family radical SAM enzyme